MRHYAAMTAIADRLRTTLRVAGRVVGNPVLLRVELAFLAFNIVEYGSWVAILLYAYDVTGPESVGIVAVGLLVPAALVAPPMSSIGDRFPRQWVLVGAYAGLALANGLTALGMLASWPVLLVYLIAATDAFPLTPVRPTHNALLPSLARGPDELTAANAGTSIAEAGGMLLGPSLAAVVLWFAPPGAVLLVLAAVSAVAMLLIIPDAIRHPVSQADEAAVAAVTDTEPWVVRIAAGFRALMIDGEARMVVLILGARTLMIGVTDVLFVLLALELFGTGDSGAAVLSAAVGVGGIIGGASAIALVGRRRMSLVMLASAVTWGTAFALVGVAASGTLAPFLIALGGIGLSLLDVAGRTVLQRGVRNAVLARVFGILEGLMMAALAVGSILVPVVVAMVGLETSVLVFAAFLPVVLVLAWPGLRAMDRRAAVPARGLDLLRRIPMFDALDPPALEGLARAAAWIEVAAGAVVIREGDVGDRFYVLESGAVEVERGGAHVRALTSSGDAFGEIALLLDVPRTATVTAAATSTMLVLDRATFLAAVTGHPVVHTVAARTVDAHLRADAGGAAGGS
jgi:Cyclic nucleotide-binding domain/Major Facilitator Superfamily